MPGNAKGEEFLPGTTASVAFAQVPQLAGMGG